MTTGLLSLGNARRIKETLANILDQNALDAIELEIATNSIALFRLGLAHYRFASRQHANHWRQKVSRYYYAAYSASRALRLFVNGHYSTQPDDHRRVDDLPDDFPHRAAYANRLPILREDRNICDYNHTSRARDLAFSVSESADLVRNFLIDTRAYLRGKGLTL